jgi:hypothetical protein
VSKAPEQRLPKGQNAAHAAVQLPPFKGIDKAGRGRDFGPGRPAFFCYSSSLNNLCYRGILITQLLAFVFHGEYTSAAFHGGDVI